MKMCLMKVIIIAILCIVLPMAGHAQVADKVYGLNSVLDKLFDEMLPLCSRLIDVGRAIAGLAALTYIATRVWKHIAQAEPINFYPLMRPFAIGLAILLFPALVGLINGALKPTVLATEAMSKDSRKAILWHIEQQEKSVTEPAPSGGFQGGDDGLEKYEKPGDDDGGMFSDLKNAFSNFSLKNAFKVLVMELLQTLYASAALCINTVRTFYLIVLVLLGPLTLGLSVFEGFEHTLPNWFARYINVYMWLPVANIFGAITSKILENMLTLDQDFAGSIAYMIFLIISIVGYTTVPTVAGYIIQAGGRDALMGKMNDMGQAVGTAAAGAVKSMS